MLRVELRALIDTIPGCFFHYDDNGRLVRWNQAFLDATGLTEAECLDHVMSSSIADEDRGASESAHASLASDGRAATRAHIRNRLTGARTPFFFSSRAIPNLEGDGHSIVGIGIDITETVHAEHQLRREKAFFAALLDSSFDGYVVISPQHEVLAHNRQLITSATPVEDFTSMRLDHDLVRRISRYTDDPGCFVQDLGAMLASPSERSRFLFRTTAGTVHECAAMPVLDQDGTQIGQLLSFRDITAQERAQVRYEHLATHDEVTGLLNRATLFDRLNTLIAAGTPFGLISLDIDRFQRLNHTYGHLFGDRVLRLIGERIRAATDPSHAIGRHGGDEFLIVVPECDTREALTEVAQSILLQFESIDTFEGRTLDIKAHMGLCRYPDDGASVADLVTHSDSAMNHLKRPGRNSIEWYTAEMGSELTRRIELERHLRRAIASRGFDLVYQPKVALDTGRITGVEALIRWHDPDLGWVSPTNFIPLAEKTRLILPLGEWVLQTACTQAKQWVDRGVCEVPVAVNVSLVQIFESDFVESVERILAATGLDPRFIELELTESTLAEDPNLVRDVVARLHALGVTISIDDFGTGYSSLSYLKDFQVDKLKIDRSFTGRIHCSPEDNAIVQTAISIADSLGLIAIAEGVETAAQAEFLRASGCVRAQGFLFSRPVSALEIERMFTGDQQGVLALSPAASGPD